MVALIGADCSNGSAENGYSGTGSSSDGNNTAANHQTETGNGSSGGNERHQSR